MTHLRKPITTRKVARLKRLTILVSESEKIVLLNSRTIEEYCKRIYYFNSNTTIKVYRVLFSFRMSNTATYPIKLIQLTLQLLTTDLYYYDIIKYGQTLIRYR